MVDGWHLVVEPLPLAEADAAWRAWLQDHDLSRLSVDEIRVDTGRGTDRDWRRYWIKSSALDRVVVRTDTEED